MVGSMRSRSGTRKGGEAGDGGGGKDRGSSEREEAVWGREHWVSGHLSWMDILLAACMGGSWELADHRSHQVSRHQFMDEHISSSPSHRRQPTSP